MQPIPMSSKQECRVDEATAESSCTRGDFTDKDYFTKDLDGFYYLRRKTVFNLYAFDSLRSDNHKIPELNFLECDFEYFTSDQEALVVVETGNYGKFDSQAMGLYGEDQGANIQIIDSTFQHLKFCNGLILYRSTESVDIGNDHLLFNFTAQRNRTGEAEEVERLPRIQVMGSKFVNIGLAQPLTQLTWLEGSSEGKDALEGLWAINTNHHIGLILNLYNYKGAVSLTDNTFDKNMVYIPDILIT